MRINSNNDNNPNIQDPSSSKKASHHPRSSKSRSSQKGKVSEPIKPMSPESIRSAKPERVVSSQNLQTPIKPHGLTGEIATKSVMKEEGIHALRIVLKGLKGMSPAERKEVMKDVYTQLQKMPIDQMGKALMGQIQLFINHGNEAALRELLKACEKIAIGEKGIDPTEYDQELSDAVKRDPDEFYYSMRNTGKE